MSISPEEAEAPEERGEDAAQYRFPGVGGHQLPVPIIKQSFFIRTGLDIYWSQSLDKQFQ